MPVTEIGDPRLQAMFGANDPRDVGVRPSIRLPGKGLSPVAIAIGAAFLALLLFFTLNSRRTIQTEPTTRPAAQLEGGTAWEAPPPLYLPPVREVQIVPAAKAQAQSSKTNLEVAPQPYPEIRPAPQVIYTPQAIPQMAPLPIPSQPPRASGGAPLVVDVGGGPAPGGDLASRGTFSSLVPSGQTNMRARSSALANRSTTIPQGTLIPAVLETAFNSTQPGFARAIVSKNVRSFDGMNVLIPRGSRLTGEYRSDVGQTQKRAVIIWTRLIRPDGMTIVMDSPAVDTLGRGGVEASVNTHFFRRLGDAILQTTVGIGSALSQRAVTGPVLVLPGAAGATAPMGTGGSYVPTLTVPAGKSISIFVAHDLDFSTPGSER